MTSPVSQGPGIAQPPRKSFAVPRPRSEKGVPLLRIRIKSQAWRKPVIVVAKAPLRGLPFTYSQPLGNVTSVSASLSAEGTTCLQSCGSTQGFGGFRSEGFGDVRCEGFGGFMGEAITKKRRAGGRHKRKATWAEAAPILTNPLVTTFEAEQPGVLTGEETFVGTSGWEETGTFALAEENDGLLLEEELEKSEPEFIDNISKRPGLRTVRRRVHVAPEDEEGGEGESPGRQAKWKRKAPRDAKVGTVNVTVSTRFELILLVRSTWQLSVPKFDGFILTFGMTSLNQLQASPYSQLLWLQKNVRLPAWITGEAPEMDEKLLSVTVLQQEPDDTPVQSAEIIA